MQEVLQHRLIQVGLGSSAPSTNSRKSASSNDPSHSAPPLDLSTTAPSTYPNVDISTK